jgi:hypothetical protein
MHTSIPFSRSLVHVYYQNMLQHMKPDLKNTVVSRDLNRFTDSVWKITGSQYIGNC